MPKKYRAECITCEEYVGPKRGTEAEAQADCQEHLNDGNQDHETDIQIIQS